MALNEASRTGWVRSGTGEGVLMRRKVLSVVVALSLAVLTAAPAALAGSHSIGIGANYWKTIDDLDTGDVTDIDESGLSWIASYQYAPAGIFKPRSLWANRRRLGFGT